MHLYPLGAAFLLFPLLPIPGRAQATAPTPILEGIHAEGSHLPEAPILAETGLKLGRPVTKDQLQLSADRLGQLGLFSKINYDYRTRVDGLSVTFHLEDAPRVPVSFDNIPWFTDGELGDAIRKTVPFFDGTAPEAGVILDRVGDAIASLLATHKLNVTVEHQVTDNPLGAGTIQQFKINGASARIAQLEFSDPLAGASRALQQHLSEIVGKPYSRQTIDLFLMEKVRPSYLQQGYLRVQLGPPDIRLAGNPNLPLTDSLPVFVPVVLGPQFHWDGVRWTGNTVITAAALTGHLGRKLGEIANGYEIDAGWDRAREEYERLGFLDVKLDPRAVFNDQAQTVVYEVSMQEGQQYRSGQLVLTGVSLAAERLIRSAWPMTAGEVFDKQKYEEFLIKLQKRSTSIFGELPIHYEEVGHWLRTDAAKNTVDVLFDFK